jgi:hypothetical protein
MSSIAEPRLSKTGSTIFKWGAKWVAEVCYRDDSYQRRTKMICADSKTELHRRLRDWRRKSKNALRVSSSLPELVKALRKDKTLWGGTTALYVLRGFPSGMFKIGISSNPKQRIQEIQATCPDYLEVVHLVCGSERLEAQLHRILDGLRSHGEWFSPLTPVDSLIKTLRLPKYRC